ncbi:histidine kinase N-terminal 7TM domain-containing protein [Haloplanus litoreus]|uniref:histidine kinase N-terminal 7TM domain-containing protein n=1 Tax=Haloplanus litoreus TaxID=767515 RepID=UPI00361F1C8C
MVDVAPYTVAYALLFAAAAAGCGAAAVRARRIEDAETRRGLVVLLATSGIWAASHAGLLLLPTRDLKTAVYLIGLILGFSTVFAWLYFCSAYTGRNYHRRPGFRRAAIALYLAVVVVKITNPIHHLYFTTAFVASPFPHLAIRQGLFHWIVTGLSYTLAAVGMFTLFEAFGDADYDARSLGVLVALSGAPVVLDIVGYATPLLIDMIHAPLGVAAFAVGVLFAFENRFFAVQLTDGVEERPSSSTTTGGFASSTAQPDGCFPISTTRSATRSTHSRRWPTLSRTAAASSTSASTGTPATTS